MFHIDFEFFDAVHFCAAATLSLSLTAAFAMLNACCVSHATKT